VRKIIHLLAAMLFVTSFFQGAPRLMATSVRAPDFNQLIRGADLIFTGRALRQRSEWRRIDGQRSIVTLVTFEVLNVHKGQAGATVQLQFLGGKIGDAALRVDGMPSFHPGERAVLFVDQNGANASPLVGFYHGKFNVLTDDSIAQHDGAPLSDVAEIGRTRVRLAHPRAMTHEAFATRIRNAARNGN
jgi:hypothetical protein